MNTTRRKKNRTLGFAPGDEIASGTNKTVRRTRTGNNFSFVVSDTDSLNNKELVIVEFKQNKKEEIYNELVFYERFGNLNISPKIMGVNIPGSGHISLRNFLRQYNVSTVPNNVSYLVEKFNCSDDIFRYFTDSRGNFDHIRFFRDLRRFLVDKILANGIINTDIKIPNLCVDGNGDIKMIDFDPNMIKPLQSHIQRDDYVNYMLFQVYCNLIYSYKKNIQLNEIIERTPFETMIRRIYRFADREFHPLFMILWYLGDNRYNNDVNVVRSHFNTNDQYRVHVNSLMRNILSSRKKVKIVAPVITPTPVFLQQNSQLQPVFSRQPLLAHEIASPPVDTKFSVPWAYILPIIGAVIASKYALGYGKKTRRKKNKI